MKSKKTQLSESQTNCYSAVVRELDYCLQVVGFEFSYCGLYYKRVTIVIDAPSVVSK
jgi:hypothetical protein